MKTKDDIFAQLKSEHDDVKALLKTTHEAAEEKRKELLARIKSKLIPHARAEEKTLYSALREAEPNKELCNLVNEAYIEHETADHLFSEVEKTSVNDEMWKAKFAVFRENVEHHIKEEENELFSKVKKYISAETSSELLKAFLVEKKRFESSLPTQHQIKSKAKSSHLSSEVSIRA